MRVSNRNKDMRLAGAKLRDESDVERVPNHTEKGNN